MKISHVLVLLVLLFSGCLEEEKLPVGSACNSSFDCITQNCVEGECAKAAENGRCESSYDCEAGYTCPSGRCVKRHEWCLIKDGIGIVGMIAFALFLIVMLFPDLAKHIISFSTGAAVIKTTAAIVFIAIAVISAVLYIFVINPC